MKTRLKSLSFSLLLCILFSTLVFTLVSLPLLGNSISIKDQASQQHYRKSYLKNKSIDYLLELNIHELNLLIKQLKTIKEQSLEQKKTLFVLQLLYTSKGIQAINAHDAKVIKSYLKRFNQQKIPSKELQKLFLGKKSPFLKKMFQVAQFLKRKNNSRMIKYQTYNYLGPYLEVYKSLCTFNAKEDRDIYKELKRKKTCSLKESYKKELSISVLEKKIKQGDHQRIGHYHAITPHVAKIILTEFLLSKLPKAKQKSFFNQLIHKTNYAEFTCGKLCNQAAPQYKQKLDLFIPHMGYQLLNSIRAANLLETLSQQLLDKKIEKIKTNKSVQSLGIECSLYLQRAIERAQIAQIKGRMKTSNMKRALYPKVASKKTLHIESQLQFADIIKLHGHTYVFLGYKEINNQVYAVTIEAVGGNVRSVGVFYRDFYDPEVGSFNKEKDRHGRIQSVSRKDYYMLYRLKK